MNFPYRSNVTAIELTTAALVAVYQCYEPGTDVHGMSGISGLARNVNDEGTYDSTSDAALGREFLTVITSHIDAANADYSAVLDYDIIKVVRLAEDRCETIWNMAVEILSRRKCNITFTVVTRPYSTCRSDIVNIVSNRRDVLLYVL